MRYIKKLATPQSFTEKTDSLKKWGDYCKQKRALRKYILKYEQNNLCVYCESSITHKKEYSHLEHIKPKANNKFSHLVFNYPNIVVSCNGNCHLEGQTRHSCGHKKGQHYDDTKFLNPVELTDIRDYFKYDIDTGDITESSKNTGKTKYMIETLHLNDASLPLARKKALENFIKKMNKINKNQRKNKLIEVLNKENIAFVSFLRFRYKEILKT